MYKSTFIAALSLLVISSAQAETGLASYYGGRGHGMTCAHRTRPMGSIVRVSYGGIRFSAVSTTAARSCAAGSSISRCLRHARSA